MPEFEAGLVQSLAERYPEIDVQVLAESIGSGAKNPNAVLVAMCKAAHSAPQATKATKAEKLAALEETISDWRRHGEPGDFRPDGSWNPRGEHRSLYWRLVDSLVAVRRQEWRKVPPADFARFIESREDMKPMFPNLHHWSKIDRYDLWPTPPCSTSAESAVKYAGHGPLALTNFLPAYPQFS